MRKIFLWLVAVAGFQFVSAQQAVRKFAATGGTYVITKYSDNIYKINFNAKGVTHNEPVSDAVVLKPAAGLSFQAYASHDTVYIRNRPFVVKAFAAVSERGFYFPLDNDEMIFGSGERALPLNRRGYRLNLYNNPWYGYSQGADNLNYSVPFITSSKGYGLFFDNPSKSYIDIGKTSGNILQYGASSGELNVYVIIGNYRDILQSYYRLTGTQPLPPRWAMGNLMSRFGYTGEEQVTKIAGQMKEAQIPVDAVIFDLFWFGDSIKGTMGNLDWVNKTAWPNPPRMIGRFKEQGIHSLLVTEPFFLESAHNYSAAKKYLATDSSGHAYTLTDFYFGRGGLVDIFRKDARQWFWQFYKKQAANGIDGWWCDLGEPEKHPSDLYHNLRDLDYTRRFRADEVHNLFGHTWTRMLFEQYAKEYPAKRLFSLNRSGFAGSQRYSIFPWTGDVSRSWSGLQAQLPVLLGMSMSGVPYVHSDAGGFAGGEGDNELYVRWLQFAAYTPIFRPHGTALYEKDPNAFSFPSEPALIDAVYRPYARAAVRTRYEMLPYNYTLAYRQAAYGQPLMSPLYYYFSTDTATAHVDDEYMWGENVLVAPVLQKGAEKRRYYLPAGNWFNEATGGWRTGGWHTDDVALDRIPVFFRAGSFVPMMDTTGFGTANLSSYHGDALVVHYTAARDSSSYEWYDDDGQTKSSLTQNRYELVTFSASGMDGKKLRVHIRSNGGQYAGRPASRRIELVLHYESSKFPVAATVNGQRVEIKTSPAESGRVSVFVDFKGRPLDLLLMW